MAIFSHGRRSKPRRFEYEPRYYNPEKDNDLRRRMRTESMTRNRRRSPGGLIYFSLLLAMAVYFYVRLGG